MTDNHISNDHFIEEHDGSITYFTNKNHSTNSATINTDTPSFMLTMKCPSNLKDKVDGMGISYSYLVDNNITEQTEYTYPTSSENIVWKGFTDKSGQFIAKVFYYSQNSDNSYDIKYEESIVIDIE